MTDEPEAKPRRRWGWVIASVVAFLFVVLIVVPGLLSSGRATAARNASASLKTLTSAEADLRQNDRDENEVNDYWVGDVSRLYFMETRKVPIKLIELSVACADGAPKGTLEVSSPKAGYRYVAMKTDESGAPYDRGGGRNPSKFAFCAYPDAYKPQAWYRKDFDVTTFTFIVNEELIIWKKDTGAKPVTQWPKDLWAEGWVKLD